MLHFYTILSQYHIVPTKKDQSQSSAGHHASQELQRAKSSYSKRRTAEGDIQAQSGSDKSPETLLWRKSIKIFLPICFFKIMSMYVCIYDWPVRRPAMTWWGKWARMKTRERPTHPRNTAYNRYGTAANILLYEKEFV